MEYSLLIARLEFQLMKTPTLFCSPLFPRTKPQIFQNQFSRINLRDWAPRWDLLSERIYSNFVTVRRGKFSYEKYPHWKYIISLRLWNFDASLEIYSPLPMEDNRILNHRNKRANLYPRGNLALILHNSNFRWGTETGMLVC